MFWYGAGVLASGGQNPEALCAPAVLPQDGQCHFNLLDRSGVQVLADCEAQGIMFVPYFPLASGQLSSYHELTGPTERLGATLA